MSDLSKIERRIEALEAELARLRIARDVLSEMAASPTAPPQGKANGAAITLRRVEAPGAASGGGKPAAAKPAAAKRTPASREKLREKILAELHKGPAISADLCKKFRLVTKSEKQTVYQTLFEMNKAGVVEKSGHGNYSLTPSPASPQAEAEPAMAH